MKWVLTTERDSIPCSANRNSITVKNIEIKALNKTFPKERRKEAFYRNFKRECLKSQYVSASNLYELE